MNARNLLTSHTPGPWRVEPDSFPPLIWGGCDPDDSTSYGMGVPVAEICKDREWARPRNPTREQKLANARLIAAAPELFEALSNLIVIAGTPITARQEEVFVKARAAIAKARGQ